jgi:ribosomal protein S24E
LSTIEIISERENTLLARREYSLNFVGGSGLVTRQAASEAIATKLGVDKALVKLISLEGKFGMRNLKATAFVYSNVSEIKRQLPKYMSIRGLPKEERKKAREAAKPQPAAKTAETAKK